MRVVQILPELNSGGVERGTLEVAAHLVRNGHEAIVISHGGRLVSKLEASGARHLAMPVVVPIRLAIGRDMHELRVIAAAERPDQAAFKSL
jgi:hypothetical protein